MADNSLLRPPPETAGGRSLLLLPLEGEILVRIPEGAHLVRAGEILSSRRSVCVRNRWDTDLTTMHLEWEPGVLAHRASRPSTPARFSPQGYRALRSLLLPIVREGFELTQAGRLLSSLSGILRAEGFPLEPVCDRSVQEPVSPELASLSRRLDWAFSSLQQRPMSVDFESSLSWSRWQVREQVREFLERYDFNQRLGLRELLHFWRLGTGALLMSASGATTERVSRLLGYGSPGAFCDAFADVGLPSPGSLRERLLRI